MCNQIMDIGRDCKICKLVVFGIRFDQIPSKERLLKYNIGRSCQYFQNNVGG